MEVTIQVDGVEVTVEEGDYLGDEGITDDVMPFAGRLVSMLPRMKEVVAREYLDLYNNDWRDDEVEKPIDAAEFGRRLKNPTISLLNEKGSAFACFDDSGMFGGHALNVSIDGGEISGAELAG